MYLRIKPEFIFLSVSVQGFALLAPPPFFEKEMCNCEPLDNLQVFLDWGSVHRRTLTEKMTLNIHAPNGMRHHRVPPVQDRTFF
jgi:hypothetical protein